MTKQVDNRGAHLGYLLVMEDETHGFTGGLLIVSAEGRPLEFHCTEPVRPNRAQEILFGTTLRPFLVGEQIGSTLLRKTQLPIDLLLAATTEEAEAGRHLRLPTVVVDEMTTAKSATTTSDAKPLDERLVATLERLTESIEITEPFERVRDAIREAQRLSSSSTPQESAA